MDLYLESISCKVPEQHKRSHLNCIAPSRRNALLELVLEGFCDHKADTLRQACHLRKRLRWLKGGGQPEHYLFNISLLSSHGPSYSETR